MLFSALITIITICIISLVIYVFTGGVATYITRAKNPFKLIDSKNKTLYLTFDDGVNPKYTLKLLDLLKYYNIKCSFFVLASTVNENKYILQRMKDDGHLIGLHSYNHKNQILQSPFGLKQDFKASIAEFNKIGIHPTFYRPPWGHIRLLGLHLCKMYDLKVVLWNVIIQDWRKDSTVEALCDKVKRKLHGNSVICLHDGRGKNEAPLKTIAMLTIMIPIWEMEGYNFETVDQLY